MLCENVKGVKTVSIYTTEASSWNCREHVALNVCMPTYVILLGLAI